MENGKGMKQRKIRSGRMKMKEWNMWMNDNERGQIERKIKRDI